MRNMAVLLAAIMCCAQAAAQTSWAEKMFKEGTVHDFGSVPRGSQLYHKFKITNIYAVPLEISSRVGCNCVTASVTKNVLQPRDESYLEVTMDTRKFTGVKTVNIHFTVGPEYISTAVLQVTANSRVDVVLNPGQINFGVVTRGQAPEAQSIDVEYAGVLDWRATEIAKHNAPIETTVKELYRRPGQVGYRVTATLKADAPAGPMKHEIYLKTNDPASPLVPLLVEATVQATLTIGPNPVAFGTLQVGESYTKLVLVRGPKPFRITAVEDQGDGVSVEVPDSAATNQRLKVRFQPGKKGTVRKTLKVKTDLAGEAPLTLIVEGSVDD